MQQIIIFLIFTMAGVFQVTSPDFTLNPEQIVQIVMGSLPPDSSVPPPSAVYYTRSVREQTLPPLLGLGTKVVFTATNEMGTGRTGQVEGVIVGYMLTSPPNVKPNSIVGAVNLAEWPEQRYIVNYYYRDPCPADVLNCGFLAHEVVLPLNQFTVTG